MSYVNYSSVLLLKIGKRGDCLKSWNSDIDACGMNSDWLSRLNDLLGPTEAYDQGLHDIVNSLRECGKITVEQGIFLWNYPDLNVVGYLAHLSKKSRYGDNVFFNSNLHVNQTNICTLACKFCAFRRGK